MPKIVLLSEGFAGRTYELSVEKTTVGRVDDNAFQISEPSVSSHHAEFILKGEDVHIKDLGSTNGTFINGDKVTEAVLKPGQTLKLGTVEMRLEGKDGAPPAKPGDKPAAAPPKKDPTSQTRVIQRGGVKLNELQDGAQTPKTQPSAFSKKSNKATIIFIAIAVVLGLAILISLAIAFTGTGAKAP